MRTKQSLALTLSALAVLAGAAAAQVLIDEDFAMDPIGNNWQLNGSAVWDEANQRVVMTPAVNDNRSSMFFRELIDIDNFKLEAKVKVCCTTSGTPADGMAITFFQSDNPLADAIKIGFGGGGLCVTNLTTGPQIVVEFDIYSNGACCEACGDDPALNNHVGVEYSPTGFAGTECALTGDCLPGPTPRSACAGRNTVGFSMYGDHTIDKIGRAHV